MRVRDATLSDLSALDPLVRAFAAEVPEPPWVDVDIDDELHELAEAIEREIAVVVEDRTGKLAGFALARRCGRRRGLITDLYVIQSARADGLAGRLTGRVVERMRALGLDTVQLDVLAGNERARAIYANWGFEEEGLRLATPLDALARRLAGLA